MRSKEEKIGFKNLSTDLDEAPISKTVKNLVLAYHRHSEVEKLGQRVAMDYLMKETGLSEDEVLHGLYSAFLAGFLLIRLYRFGVIPKKSEPYRLTSPKGY